MVTCIPSFWLTGHWVNGNHHNLHWSFRKKLSRTFSVWTWTGSDIRLWFWLGSRWVLEQLHLFWPEPHMYCRWIWTRTQIKVLDMIHVFLCVTLIECTIRTQSELLQLLSSDCFQLLIKKICSDVNGSETEGWRHFHGWTLRPTEMVRPWSRIRFYPTAAHPGHDKGAAVVSRWSELR